MNTTSLLIEFVIAGSQAAFWLALLALSLFGYDWINLERVRGGEVFVAALSLLIFYPLGIFADRKITEEQPPG